MADDDVISFVVRGRPVPKGSTHAFKHSKTGAVITQQNRGPELYRWQARVGQAAIDVGVEVSEDDFAVLAVFMLARPRSHYRSNGVDVKPTSPRRPPGRGRLDIDKLLRAVLDGLTGVAWVDDAQVAEANCEKQYTNNDVEGVAIRLTRLD